jgi:hypothetical protein
LNGPLINEEASATTGQKSWLQVADEYCFGPTSPTTLGVVRIVVGFLAFVNWSMIGIDWDAWFSERGYVPNWLGSLFLSQKTPFGFWTHWQVPRINVLNGITDPRLTIPFYILVIVAAILTSLGLFTRYAAFALAIGTITLHHRDSIILHGGDTVLRLATIYLAVSPCGKACSLDRLIGLWKNREPHGPIKVSFWSQRLFQYNLSLIYFTTLWLKWDGTKWRDLTATWYPSRLPEFYRFPVPEFFKSLLMTKVATLGTVTTEFLLGTLIFFPPARKWVILAGILMHAYIEYSMNIPLFSFLMYAMYLSFFEGHEFTGWAERMGLRMRKWHVEVRLPSGTKLTPRGVAFLSAIDPFKMVAYLPGMGASWAAARLDGTPIPVGKAIATRSAGSWIFAWMPGFLSKLVSQTLEPLPVEDSVPEVPIKRSGKKTR